MLPTIYLEPSNSHNAEEKENFCEVVSEKNDQLGTALEVEVKVLVEEKNRCIAQRLKKIRRDHHISRILHPIGAVAREIGKGKKICLLKNNGKLFTSCMKNIKKLQF